jgi:hypothetical protein
VIAYVCYEANRAICAALGDAHPLPWSEQTEDFKTKYEKGVGFALAVESTAESQHEAWMQTRLADGWTYAEGPINPEAKTHPDLVPYGQLPAGSRVKGAVFRAVAKAMSGAGPGTYHLGSSPMIHGPGMLENMRAMCRTGETERAVKLFAAMYPSVPVDDALVIIGAQGSFRQEADPADPGTVIVTVVDSKERA